MRDKTLSLVFPEIFPGMGHSPNFFIPASSLLYEKEVYMHIFEFVGCVANIVGGYLGLFLGARWCATHWKSRSKLFEPQICPL